MDPMTAILMGLSVGGPFLQEAFKRSPNLPGYTPPSAQEKVYEQKLNRLTRPGSVSSPMVRHASERIGASQQAGLNAIDNEFEDSVQKMNAVLKVMGTATDAGREAVYDADTTELNVQHDVTSELLDRATQERMYKTGIEREDAMIKAGAAPNWGGATYEGAGNLFQYLNMQKLLDELETKPVLGMGVQLGDNSKPQDNSAFMAALIRMLRNGKMMPVQDPGYAFG